MSAVGHELLDDPGADPGLVRESLHHLARSNAWFGGVRAARLGVVRLLADRSGGPITILDIGTGAGDLPKALADALAPRFAVRAIGIDRHPAAAPLAFANGVPTAVADAFALPIGTGAVDVVLVSQVAHHFSAEGIAALARECGRVARIGVVIADLRRSRLAQVGFRLGSRILGFDRITREDGVTSLQRGFLIGQLDDILRGAGIVPRITTHLGARIVATWSTAR